MLHSSLSSHADADPDSTTTTPPTSDLQTSPCETILEDDDNSCDLLLEDDTFRDSSESVTGDDPSSFDKEDSKSRKKSSKSCNSDTKSGEPFFILPLSQQCFPFRNAFLIIVIIIYTRFS